MRKRVLVVALGLLGITGASVAAPHHTSKRDQELEQVMARAQNLQQEVIELQNEIKRLKTPGHVHAVKPAHPKHASKHTPKHTPKHAHKPTPSHPLTSHEPVFGSAIVASPYLGERPSYEGGELISNIPGHGADLRLLKQRKKLMKKLAEQGSQMPNHPILEVSGELAGRVQYERPFKGAGTSDIDLDDANLDIDAMITPWVAGFMEFDYDSSSSSSSSKRSSNSRIVLDKGFITIGNLLRSPFYGTIGQYRAPFGHYKSNMLGDPLTKELGDIKTRVIQLGFQQPGSNAFDGQVYVFRGDSYTGHSRINNVGANLTYHVKKKDVKGKVGAGVIRNLTDSDGMQDNGESKGFSGFASCDKCVNPEPERLQNLVPGLDVNADFTLFDHVLLDAEYVGAAHAYRRADMTYNEDGARPQATNLEAGYAFTILNRPTSFAVGYGRTWQALALALPEHSYVATLNTKIWRDTLASLEFRHEQGYSKSAVATAAGGTAVKSDKQGHVSNRVTAKFAIHF